MPTKKIIHIDMDCFYAAIEIRDRPELAEKPVAVGGLPEQRSVLCTCNYVARKFGVRSAMPSSLAKRICPELIILPVNMSKYREVAGHIRDIFFQYTDLVEPLSLDEAYLDVTQVPHHDNRAVRIASEIRRRIYDEHQLTASAGIAPNKFLAKIASEWKKPNGQFAILPSDIEMFMQSLPIEKIFGVGKVTALKMHRLNIYNCLDLQHFSLIQLVEHFGNFGERLYFLCRGQDERMVQPDRERKSVSVEETFLQDLPTLTACLEKLPELYANLRQRLKKHSHRKVHKQFVKLKFYDFQQITRERVVYALSEHHFAELLRSAYKCQQKPIRLIGVGVGFRTREKSMQTELNFDD